MHANNREEGEAKSWAIEKVTTIGFQKVVFESDYANIISYIIVE